MYAQQFQGFAMEKDFEAPVGMARDLAACNLAIVSYAHFVGNVGVGELLLGLADERNLRNGVNPVRVAVGIGLHLQTESPCGGDAPLFHGNGSQAGKADHVADSEDVRLSSAKIRVNFNSSAIVCLDARRGQV